MSGNLSFAKYHDSFKAVFLWLDALPNITTELTSSGAAVSNSISLRPVLENVTTKSRGREVLLVKRQQQIARDYGHKIFRNIIYISG